MTRADLIKNEDRLLERIDATVRAAVFIFTSAADAYAVIQLPQDLFETEMERRGAAGMTRNDVTVALNAMKSERDAPVAIKHALALLQRRAAAALEREERKLETSTSGARGYVLPSED